MADNYIDYQEMEIYGNHTHAALQGLETPTNGVAQQRQDLAQKTQDIKQSKQGKRDTTDVGQEKRGGRDKLSGRVVRNMRSLKNHLDGVNEDEDDLEIDLKLFFADGNLGDLSSSTPSQVLLKANYALQGFAKSADFPLKDKKLKKLTELRDLLAKSLKEATEIRPVEGQDTTARQKAGEEWRVFYRGLRYFVRGLLIQQKRESELHLYFKDEAAPGPKTAQGTTTPATPPGDPPQGGGAPSTGA